MTRPTQYCSCLRSGPSYKAEEQIGVDKWCDEIALQVCLQCKRRWLYYFIEHQGFSGSGRKFLGVIPDDTTLPILPEDVVEIFGKMPWYFYSGSYWSSMGWSKCSGKLAIGLVDSVEKRLPDDFPNYDTSQQSRQSRGTQVGCDTKTFPQSVRDALGEIFKKACEAIKQDNRNELTRLIEFHPWLLEERSAQHDGWTLLHLAASCNGLGATGILHDKSVDPDTRSGVDVDGEYVPGLTPLMIAAEEGALTVAQSLVEFGANVNATAANGETALWLAAKAGSQAVLHYLLANGAVAEVGFDMKNFDEVLGWYSAGTPLHTSARHGDLDAVMCLLSHGAKVDSETFPGHATPLHHASARGTADVVSALLLAGADVKREQDLSTVGLPHKYQPIHLAAKAGNVSILEVLVKNGANPNAVAPGCNQRPLDMARENRHDDAVRYLKEFVSAE